MERIDPQTAKRVWQRVQGEDVSVRPMLSAERRCLADFQQLQRLLAEKNRQLRLLASHCQQRIRCLMGIDSLLTGTSMPDVPLNPRQETPQGLLRHCYQQSVNLAGEYQRRGEHPEYGPVYLELAKQMRQQCIQILELIATAEMKKSTR